MDHCGPLEPAENIRKHLSAAFTADATGPALLDLYNWKDGPVSSLNVNFIDNLRVRAKDPDFSASKRHLSNSTGDWSQLSLKPGAEHAGRTYLILTGVTGTWPGFKLSGIDIHLNPDAWTTAALQLVNTPFMQGFMAQLDANGEATARLDYPGSALPSANGLVMYFDYVVLQNPYGPPVKKASHPLYILFIY